MTKVEDLLLGVVSEIKSIGLEYNSRTLAPQNRPILIGDLCDILEQYSGNTIEIIETEFGGEYPPVVKGFYFREGTKVNIFVDMRLNNCNRRFVVAKELCHVFTDNNEENSTSRAGDLVDILLKNQNMYVPGDSELARQQNIDEFAKLVGILLLFPFEDMKRASAQIANKVRTHEQISEDFKIPLIKVLTSLDPLWHHWFATVHDYTEPLEVTN